MKLKLLILLFTFVQALQAQINKKVYFIGNSYTGTNNLPQLIKNIAQAQGNTFYFESHIPGGSTLSQHAANPNVLAKLNQGTWDHVVLQEQSQTPTFPDGDVNQTMFPAAQTLVQTTKLANACTVPIFYMSWGYKNGDSRNCPYLPYVCTYEDMDNVIAYRYMLLAQRNQSLVSPVGQVWREIRQLYPNYELYTSDNSHPSLLGSMAAAYTFYTIIYKQDPTTLTYTTGLTAQQAIDIKNVVKDVVFDNLATWFVGVYDNPTNFNYTQQGETVAFENLSTNATTFLWDFNDGTTSTLENPTHVFTQNGTYQVTLTTNGCNENSQITKTVTIANLSLQNIAKKVRLYPNPASNILFIPRDAFKSIELYNMEGKSFKVKFISEDTLDISDLASGLYLIKFIDTEGIVYTEKWIKK